MLWINKQALRKGLWRAFWTGLYISSLAEEHAQLIFRVGELFQNALAKIHLLVYRLHYCHYMERNAEAA